LPLKREQGCPTRSDRKERESPAILKACGIVLARRAEKNEDGDIKSPLHKKEPG
jgi:hypothetical protein